jgi:TnpA family transposase
VHIVPCDTSGENPDVQPDTLHADTQGQSEPVFGLCRLLGIKLMPRMRGLSDAIFYRPAKTIRYEHIDALFGGEIDWDLIAHTRAPRLGGVLLFGGVAGD